MRPKKARFVFMAKSRSASATTLPQRLERRLRAYNWRRVAVLAGCSLVFSLALVSYLFGADGHFFGRLFSAFFVVFWLLAFTVLAAVPFVGWAAANWFGKGWAEAPQPVGRVHRPPAVAALPSAVPRRSNTVARASSPESYS
jgi:hypothetical protein